MHQTAGFMLQQGDQRVRYRGFAPFLFLVPPPQVEFGQKAGCPVGIRAQVVVQKSHQHILVGIAARMEFGAVKLIGDAIEVVSHGQGGGRQVGNLECAVDRIMIGNGFESIPNTILTIPSYGSSAHRMRCFSFLISGWRCGWRSGGQHRWILNGMLMTWRDTLCCRHHSIFMNS